MNKYFAAAGALLVFVVLLVIIGPLATIWAWNTLFGSLHSIDYTAANWFAVVILGALFRASVYVKKD